MTSISHATEQFLSPINLREVEEKINKKVTAVVIVNSLKKHQDKKEKDMAFIQMEDITAQIDGVVFSSVYERIKSVINLDSRLIIWGKVDKNKRDDRIQIIIDDAIPIDSMNAIAIEIPFQAAIDTSIQKRLGAILQSNRSDKNKLKIPVIVNIIDRGIRRSIRLGEKYWVEEENAAIESLNDANFQAHIQPIINSQIT